LSVSVLRRIRQRNTADFNELLLSLRRAERFEWEIDKEGDTVSKSTERLRECGFFQAVVAFRGSWIINTRMRCHRVTRPDWADFRGRLIADGKYEIHLWGTSFLEFRHVLAAQAAGVVVVAGKLRECVG
jgi:hypothetical protein